MYMYICICMCMCMCMCIQYYHIDDNYPTDYLIIIDFVGRLVSYHCMFQYIYIYI